MIFHPPILSHWQLESKIPNSVTTIGAAAFGSCASLTEITVGAQNLQYSSVNGVLFDPFHTYLVQYPGGKGGSYAIPYGVYTIGDDAFTGATLTNITIPKSVSTIGNYAFYYCSNLTSITIPGSVGVIGLYAFADCTSLTGVYFLGSPPAGFGSSVLNLQGIFRSDSKLTAVYYLPGATGWGATYAYKPTKVLIKPTLAITNPSKTGETWSNAVFSISGKSGTGLPLANVFYSLNDAEWTNAVIASNGTNWTAQVALIPVINTISVYAVDPIGQVSPTNTVELVYVLSAPFTVLAYGKGTISPNYSNALLDRKSVV